MKTNMVMSDKGVKLLKQWEGYKLRPYKDAAGLLTIGVGHLLTPTELKSEHIIINGIHIDWTHGITDSECEALLKQDLVRYEDAVNRECTTQLNQDQFDAMVSFCFNIGIMGFKQSSAKTRINQGNLQDVPARMRLWNKAGGKVLKGLINRRENEIKLWLGKI